MSFKIKDVQKIVTTQKVVLVCDGCSVCNYSMTSTSEVMPAGWLSFRDNEGGTLNFPELRHVCSYRCLTNYANDHANATVPEISV